MSEKIYRRRSKSEKKRNVKNRAHHFTITAKKLFAEQTDDDFKDEGVFEL